MATTITGTGITTGTVTNTASPSHVASVTPMFSVYQTAPQSVTTSFTKMLFQATEFDTTGGQFASSRFTPTITGYYQVNASVSVTSTTNGVVTAIYKTGSNNKFGSTSPTASSASVSGLVYLVAGTDYLEIYAAVNTSSVNSATGISTTYFQAALIAGA